MLNIYFVCLSYLLIVTDIVRCKPDYLFNFEAGGWLKLHTTPEIWEEAFVRCHDEGAVLASPLNKELANALHSQMTQFGVNGHIFLGTHDFYSKGDYITVEGVPLSDMQIRWGSRGDGADTGDCLTMTVDGRAYYSSCKDPLPFICYRKLNNQTMNECGTFDNDFVRCKPDYLFNLNAGGWLKLHTTPETWEEAFVRCHNDGAVLASPLNKELANALQSQMIQFGVNGHIFLGTHDLFSKGHFSSAEGVPLADMEIRWGSRGDGADIGDCLTMSVDGRAYYSSCKQLLPFICYMKVNNQTMNECGTFDDEYHLNQQTGSCYKLYHEKLSWTHAYAICASEGGHLVILNDEEEARFINGMFPALTKSTKPFEKIHIGLRAWGKSRTWTTIKGESINDVYNNWHPGQPDNFEGNQDRAAYLREGSLDDIGSEEYNAMFVCEKSPQSKRFEAIPQCTETLTRLCNACDESQLNAN